MNEKNIIGGIPLEIWKEVFAQVARNNIDREYFDDIVFYYLYPFAVDKIDNEIVRNILNEKWEFVDEAFKAIFGVDRNLV